MRRGFAPTSRDVAQRAAARGLDPMMRWMWSVASIAVRRDIGAIGIVVWFSSSDGARGWQCALKGN